MNVSSLGAPVDYSCSLREIRRIGRDAWFRVRTKNVLGLRTENGVKDQNVRGNQLCFFEGALPREQQVRRRSRIFISDSNVLAGVQANRRNHRTCTGDTKVVRSVVS
jgi:hypothetical protein